MFFKIENSKRHSDKKYRSARHPPRKFQTNHPPQNISLDASHAKQDDPNTQQIQRRKTLKHTLEFMLLDMRMEAPQTSARCDETLYSRKRIVHVATSDIYCDDDARNLTELSDCRNFAHKIEPNQHALSRASKTTSRIFECTHQRQVDLKTTVDASPYISRTPTSARISRSQGAF